MVCILGGVMSTASGNHNAGVFLGRNIQNGWDSLSPVKSAGGVSMGDSSTVQAVVSGYLGWSWWRQPTWDEDWKGNGTRADQR
ncbi:MAG: hypothetical protein IRZ33_04755 [Alicyclobacillaceae bacterium]|nr:hypothetical protein [Alicyclobacillaceae bacterium]